MKKIILPLFLLMSTLIFSQSAEEIITKAENILKGKTSQATMEMTIKTSDYERTLKMESWWVGNEKALIVIESPRKEKGNKTLKIGNEMWAYLKNTETTIKIPPSMMLQSWNGSDFSNDDLVRESNLVRDYTQEIKGTEKLDGEDCWKVELIPTPEATVVWGKLEYWVRKKDFLPSKIVYYDEMEEVVRYMEFTGVKSFHGKTLPSVWTMHNMVKKGNSTTIKIDDIKFDINISDKVFSYQELERGN